MQTFAALVQAVAAAVTVYLTFRLAAFTRRYVELTETIAKAAREQSQ